MKKSIILFISVMLFTACTSTVTPDVTEKVTEIPSVTATTVIDTVTESTTSTTTPETTQVQTEQEQTKTEQTVETNASQEVIEWSNAYASLLWNTFASYDTEADKRVFVAESPYCIDYKCNMDSSTEKYRPETQVCIADVNFDAVPELCIRRLTTPNEFSTVTDCADVYALDGTLLGTSSIFELLQYGNDCYGCIGGAGCEYIVKLTGNYPFVYASESYTDDNDVWKTMLCTGANAVVTECVETDDYTTIEASCVEHLGVKPTTLYEQGTNIPVIRGAIQVPDPTNYAEEDLYNCLLPLLQQYEEQIQAE